MHQAILVTEDGRTFVGQGFGAGGEAFGVITVHADASGYQEVLTDPASTGKVLLMAAPHVGNTGWNDEDSRSERIQAAGIIVRDPSPRPSNFRSTGTLHAALEADGVVGVAGVDTRALARHLHGKGDVRVAISTETTDAAALLAKLRAGKDA